MRHRFARFTLLLALLAHVPVHAQDVVLHGAGSSAAKHVYHTWGERFAAATGIALAYDAVGSSEGLRRIVAGAVDFGASDVAPDTASLTHDGLVLVPTVVTGATPIVNLPTLAGTALRLDGPSLAAIFAGTITRWNDPALVALNPDRALPDIPITPVARSDGSGTTYNFTDYLTKVSPEWQSRFGTAKRIDWPAGAERAKGSSGVVSAVAATPGAIGYVDYTYVLKHDLQTVALKNRAGHFVSPSLAGFRAALLASPWQAEGRFTSTLTDQPGGDSWPITMGTFVLLPERIDDARLGRDLVRFFTWAFMHGDALAAEAHFVRLPDPVQAKAYRALAQVHDAQGNVFAYQILQR